MRLAQNVDEVVQILDQLIAGYRDRRSTLAFFPALYRAVTKRVQEGIRAGQFADGARFDRLDTTFANRYFAAIDALETGKDVPRAWQPVFDAEGRPGILILQHLLLGMNAHINFDLPIATEAVARSADLKALESDFLAINAILADLLDKVQAVIDRFSPLLDILDRIGGRTDEAIVTFSIDIARDEAWHEAARLDSETPDVRERSILSLDRRVALLSERIIAPGGPIGLALELIARSEVSDAPSITDAILAVA